jgi:Ni/Co efflux regulator RcnB
MNAARIATAIALVATLATPLAASASVEDIRYDRSERSNPNWDRVEGFSAGQGSTQRASER